MALILIPCAVGLLSFPYSRRVALISIQRSVYAHFTLPCRYHSHTAVGLRSFCIAVSLSFSYSGRATLISICRVAIILIQRSGYAHFALPCRYHSHTAVGLRSFPFVVSLSFSYSGRATLILHYHVWLHLVCLGLQGGFHGLSMVQATGCDLVFSHWSVPDGPHGLSRV